MTHGQMLRKLQLAIDHIDAVLQDAPGGAVAALTDALDSIHQAGYEILEDREEQS